MVNNWNYFRFTFLDTIQMNSFDLRLDGFDLDLKNTRYFTMNPLLISWIYYEFTMKFIELRKHEHKRFSMFYILF